MRTVGIAAVLGAAGLCVPIQAAQEESPAAYSIVTTTAVSVLPRPLRGLFDARLDALQQSATAELATAPSTDPSCEDRGRHYVMLDVVAGGDVRRFPQDRAHAKRLFKQRGARCGGELPWVLLDQYAALVQAFRSGAADRIVYQAGRLLHFATDASLPFSTTADRDGQNAGAFLCTAAECDRGGASHRTVRHRYQVGLVETLRDRLHFEVRVHPGRLRGVTDPRQAVFDARFDAHDLLDELVKMDAEVLAGLGVRDAPTFLSSAEAYYRELADRAAWAVETRLEAGALLGAELITAAWTEAGKPQIHVASALPAPAESGASARRHVGSPYVASRNSKVFHKASCPHAQRIKPQNLVGFESVEAARKTGREPCKTCRPQAP